MAYRYAAPSYAPRYRPEIGPQYGPFEYGWGGKAQGMKNPARVAGGQEGAAHNPWVQFLRQFAAAHPQHPDLFKAASAAYHGRAMSGRGPKPVKRGKKPKARRGGALLTGTQYYPNGQFY